jgi:hypothetical protein
MQDDFPTKPNFEEDDDPCDPAQIREGSIVVIRAFDDVPEHRFKVSDVYDDCVGGHSLDGPLAGEYGEPEFALIKSVHRA